jgi:hypothetical protein
VARDAISQRPALALERDLCFGCYERRCFKLPMGLAKPSVAPHSACGFAKRAHKTARNLSKVRARLVELYPPSLSSRESRIGKDKTATSWTELMTIITECGDCGLFPDWVSFRQGRRA